MIGCRESAGTMLSYKRLEDANWKTNVEVFIMNNKLQAKDLINLGLFTVLYFVIGCCVAIPIGFVPIFLPVLGSLWSLITGIPFMLFLTRVKKFGMVTIMGVLSGLLMGLTGMGFWGVPMGLIFGLLGDLILKSGDYKSAKKSILGYAVFSLWMVGTYIPMYFMVEDSWASFAASFGEEYADRVMAVMPMWSIILVVTGIFVFAILGGLLEKTFCESGHRIMEGVSFSATTDKRKGIRLDPRTKLILLLTVTTLMFSTSNEGIMNFVKPVLSLIPFVLILSERRFKTAGKYLLLYLACFALERIALTTLSNLLSFVVLAMTSIMTRFAPGIMTGAWLLSSTSVSEFIGSMERMHLTEKIVIPLSVIFRFFPTISEEYQAISDAMKMRGIRFGGKNPFLMVEYRLVPLMVSVVKIGDELSAAALTRGLGAPVKRTNVCQIGFHVQDMIAILLCALCFALFLLGQYFSF